MKRSLAKQSIQRKQNTAPNKGKRVHETAAAGVSGPSQKLPHFDRIQAAFGKHDVSTVRAYVGGAATEASKDMGAEAYATGNKIAFRTSPDLHTAAHEAAHVVQQRSGVKLKGGVGQTGDMYEQHADAVADRVVAGQSAADLLSSTPGTAQGSSEGIQVGSEKEWTDVGVGSKL